MLRPVTCLSRICSRETWKSPKITRLDEFHDNSHGTISMYGYWSVLVFGRHLSYLLSCPHLRFCVPKFLLKVSVYAYSLRIYWPRCRETVCLCTLSSNPSNDALAHLTASVWASFGLLNAHLLPWLRFWHKTTRNASFLPSSIQPTNNSLHIHSTTALRHVSRCSMEHIYA